MKAPTEQQLNDPKWWDENAPEGATHYRAPGGMYYGGFYKREPDGEWYFFVDAQWEFLEKPEKSAAHPLTPRPTKPQPQEWDGEGLPPVGCECELLRGRLTEPKWVPIKVTGRGERVTVFRRLSAAGFEEITEADPDEFRPLRTKEQRERDDLKEIIRAAYLEGASTHIGGIEAATDAIIAAGWRKGDS